MNAARNDSDESRTARADLVPDLSGLDDLAGVTALVTGGTGGIGLHTAAGLAALGARVLVTGRDRARGNDALVRIGRAVPDASVQLIVADLSSLESVRVLAARVRDEVDSLHLLINNAGFLPTDRSTEQSRSTWTVNHLAPFLLTTELLPTLQRAGADRGARIVTLTSGAARLVRIYPAGLTREDLTGRQPGRPFATYGAAKLAALTVLLERGRRLPGSGITVHAADPGGADTTMTRSMGATMPGPLRLLGKFLAPTGRPAAVAARSPLVAAAAPDLADGSLITPRGTTGRIPRRAEPSAANLALWDLTVSLTALDAGLDTR